MWIIFRKTDKKIIGTTPHSGHDMAKKDALAAAVNSAAGSESPGDLDAVHVTDFEQAMAIMTAGLENLALEKGSNGNLKISITQPKLSYLRLTSDAPDVHPADGMPEIAADGKSFTTITVQKVDELWQPRAERSDNDLLYLRTDHGVLRSDDGADEISSIKLKKGKATFRLVSESTKRVATVQIFNADANLYNNGIRIEFI